MRFILIMLWVLVTTSSLGATATSVTQLFAKHGTNWVHVRKYNGAETVQGILYRFFPNNDGKKVISALGFKQGVIPTDSMLNALRTEVENDLSIIETNEWKWALKELAIATKTERFLSELTKQIISTDDSLNFSQRSSLQSALSLRDSYLVTSQETMDLAMKAVRDFDQQTLATLIDSGDLDPNLPLPYPSGLPLIGFALRNLGTQQYFSMLGRENKLDDSINQVRWLASHPSIQLDATDNQGRTFISMAAKEGSLDALKMALSLGMDVNSLDNKGYSVLMTLIAESPTTYQKIYEATKFLVEEQGALVATRNHWETTALHLAVLVDGKTIGETKLTNFLLDQGADINAYSRWMKRPLDVAKNKRVTLSPVAKLLIERGAKSTHGNGNSTR